MASSPASAAASSPAPPGRPAEIFAWAMYDWANSAYSTLSITILVSYIKEVVIRGDWGTVVWAWGISLSMFTAAVLSPILGALADANASKRRWLAVTALSGAAAAILLALASPQSTWLIILLFVVTSLAFELSLGFYNGFLPEIANRETMNRVSAWGYALGYVGGGLALALALLVLLFGQSLGLPEWSDKNPPVVQLRIGVAIMGLWWGLFTLPTLWVLRDRRPPPEKRLPINEALANALGEVAHTLGRVRVYPMLALFLLGFLFYNDGIQSVISQASTFAIDALSFKPTELVLLILAIQIVACPGAMLIGYLSDRFGQRTILMGCLAVWVGLLVVAYFVRTKVQFWILGGVLALVLGGSQSVSRAIMGLMTPPAHTAEFFGFFNLSGKATSFLGTFLFGLIIALTGNPRMAILSLLVFFLIGWSVVWGVSVEQGRRQALRA
jgi:UMF1 family MFS transporter